MIVLWCVEKIGLMYCGCAGIKEKTKIKKSIKLLISFLFFDWYIQGMLELVSKCLSSIVSTIKKDTISMLLPSELIAKSSKVAIKEHALDATK